jgi:DNA repair protein RadD
VLPTGAGKALVAALFIKEIVEDYRSRVMVMSHVQELVQQDEAELLELWPEAPCGVFSAGLKRKEIEPPILFAGIQSIEKHVHKLNPPPEVILIDECFTGETLISTPFGEKRIDNMRCGDVVYNSFGTGFIESVSINKSEDIITVRLSNGKNISCTRSHPFFTESGWIKAGDMARGQNIFSIEKMQAMRDGFLPLGWNRKWKNKACFSRKTMGKTNVLRSILRKETKKPNVKRIIEKKDVRKPKENRTQANNKRREWMLDSTTNISFINSFIRLAGGNCSTNKNAKKRPYISNLLQAGYRKRRIKNRDRIRWSKSLWLKEGKGQKERRIIEDTWVESISLEKRGSNEPVYNLQISGYPTYYANGILVHNCHLISRSDSTRYAKVLAMLKLMYPDVRVVGLTATPFRLDSGWLHKGDDAFFKGGIVYEAKLQSLIDDWYLSPLIAKPGSVQIDTTGLQKSGKDWKQDQLEARAMEGETTEHAVLDMIERGKDRKKWLVFACGADHANQIAGCLEANGISAGVVLGDTAKGKRAELISGHKYGEIRALVTVGVLTTGYNNPAIDLLAMLRPSESASLYVQMVGRGSRKAPGKENCLVLDYSGITLRHGPVDAVDPDRKPSSGEGTAPAKVCPDCDCIIAAGFRNCPFCGYEFPPPALKINKKPTMAPVLKSQIEPEKRRVSNTVWTLHKKEGKADSVRVIYTVDSVFGESFSEWIFPENKDPRGRYIYWRWCKDAGVEPMESASDVVKTRCPQAVQIETMPDGKYTKIVKKEWVR